MRGCMRLPRTRLLTLTALAGAAGAAGAAGIAAAQTPAAPAPTTQGNFGGGALRVPVSARTVARDMLLSIRVKDGRVGVDGHMFASCGLGSIRGETALSPDGTFTLSGRAKRRARVGIAQTRYFVVRGRMTPAGATGTAKLTVRARSSRRRARDCNSRVVTWTLRRPGPAVAPAAAPTAPTTLHGLTSQRASRARRAIVLHVADGGRTVHRLAFGYRTRCRHGRVTVFSNVNVTPSFRVASDGSFRKVERWRTTYSDVVARTTVVVRGRFDAAGAVAGRLAVTERFFNRRNGKRVDVCATGTRSWSARS